MLLLHLPHALHMHGLVSLLPNTVWTTCSFLPFPGPCGIGWGLTAGPSFAEHVVMMVRVSNAS